MNRPSWTLGFLCVSPGHVCGMRQLWPGGRGPPPCLFPVFTVLSPLLCQQQGELGPRGQGWGMGSLFSYPRPLSWPHGLKWPLVMEVIYQSPVVIKLILGKSTLGMVAVLLVSWW